MHVAGLTAFAAAMVLGIVASGGTAPTQAVRYHIGIPVLLHRLAAHADVTLRVDACGDHGGCSTGVLKDVADVVAIRTSPRESFYLLSYDAPTESRLRDGVATAVSRLGRLGLRAALADVNFIAACPAFATEETFEAARDAAAVLRGAGVTSVHVEAVRDVVEQAARDRVAGHYRCAGEPAGALPRYLTIENERLDPALQIERIAIVDASGSKPGAQVAQTPADRRNAQLFWGRSASGEEERGRAAYAVASVTARRAAISIALRAARNGGGSAPTGVVLPSAPVERSDYAELEARSATHIESATYVLSDCNTMHARALSAALRDGQTRSGANLVAEIREVPLRQFVLCGVAPEPRPFSSLDESNGLPVYGVMLQVRYAGAAGYSTISPGAAAHVYAATMVEAVVRPRPAGLSAAVLAETMRNVTYQLRPDRVVAHARAADAAALYDALALPRGVPQHAVDLSLTFYREDYQRLSRSSTLWASPRVVEPRCVRSSDGFVTVGPPLMERLCADRLVLVAESDAAVKP